MAHLFISYARDDDVEFVNRLYEDLSCKNGFNIWWDQKAMESRGLTFLHELQDAIVEADRLILVAGPKALQSDYVQTEWAFALEHCKVVNVVLRGSKVKELPAELRRQDVADFTGDAEYGSRIERFIKQLRTPVAPLGRVPPDVPSLPPQYVPRNNDLFRLTESVIEDLRKAGLLTPQQRTTCVHGMAGVGKSIATAALVRRCEIRWAFPQGIHWINVTREADSQRVIRRIAAALDIGLSAQMSGEDALGRIADVLEKQRVLLILDDVWRVTQIEDIQNALGPLCRLLFTTRDSSLGFSIAGKRLVALKVLDTKAARTLFRNWIGHPADAPLREQTDELINACGYLPLAVALCGAMVAAGNSVSDLLEALQTANLEYIEGDLANFPHRSVLQALKISVDFLEKQQPGMAERYSELAVFPEGENIPLAAVVKLWTHSAKCKELSARKWVTILASKALLRLDEENGLRTVRLHDLQHGYVRAIVGERLPDLHRRLLKAYKPNDDDYWSQLEDDGYLYNHLFSHLEQAGHHKEIFKLLQEETQEGRSAWYVAKNALDPSGATFLDDISEAWRLVSTNNREKLKRGQPIVALNHDIEFALTISSLTSQSANLSSEFIAALVQCGQWSSSQGFAAAWQMPTVEKMSSAFKELAPFLDVEQTARALTWFLAEQSQEYSDWVVKALLSRFVALNEAGRAIDLVSNLTGEHRTDCQEHLAHMLIDADRPMEALAAAKTIDEPGRADYICQRLAETLPLSALSDLDPMITAIQVQHYRDSALDTIAERQAEHTSFDQIIPALDSVNEPCGRATLLGILGKEAPEDAVLDCLKILERESMWWDWPSIVKQLTPAALALGHTERLLKIVSERWNELPDSSDDIPTFALADMFVTLCQFLENERTRDLMSKAERVCLLIEDPESRVTYYNKLASHSSEPYKREFYRSAYSSAHEIVDLGERVRHCLWQLQYLDAIEQDQAIDELWSELQAVEFGEEKRIALEGLATWCAQHARLDKALCIVNSIPLDSFSQNRTDCLVSSIECASAKELEKYKEKIFLLIDTILDTEKRKQVVAVLAPKLASAGCETEALEIADQITDNKYLREKVDLSLIMVVSKSCRDVLIENHFCKTRQIGDEHDIDAVFLSLSRELVRVGCSETIIGFFDQLTSEALKIELLDMLTIEQSVQSSSKFSTWTEQLEQNADDWRRCSIGLIWIRIGKPEKAVNIAHNIDNDDHYWRPKYVAELGHRGYREEAKTLIANIDDLAMRSYLLAILSMVSPDAHDEFAKVVRIALSSVKRVRKYLSILIMLASKGRSLNDDAIELIDEGASAFLKLLSEKNEYELRTLIELDPRLPPNIVEESILLLLDKLPYHPADATFSLPLEWIAKQLDTVAAERIATKLIERRFLRNDYADRLGKAQAMEVFIPIVTENYRPILVEEAIANAEAMEHTYLTTMSLSGIYPFLTEPLRRKTSSSAMEMLPELLNSEGFNFDETMDIYLAGLRQLMPALLGLDLSDLYQCWLELLRIESKRRRGDFIQMLIPAIPVISKLGGPDALMSSMRAFHAVFRRWP